MLIDTPEVTLPELKSFLIGEKVSEGYALYSEIIDDTPPLAMWWFGLMEMIFGRSLTAWHLIAFLILFIQSAFWGIILIDKKVFPENTYIPSFLFSILTFLSVDFFTVSSDLLAFGFILLALNNLLKEIEFREQRDDSIFNLGVYVGIASLFSFSYIIYLPGILLMMPLFTRASMRKFLFPIFGCLLPHLILAAVTYYRGTLSFWWQYYYVSGFQFETDTLMTIKSLLWLAAIPLAYLIISFLVVSREVRLTKYQSQVVQVMFLWLIITFLQLFLSKDLRPQSLLPLLPPVSFFLTHFLLTIRRKKFAELHFWIIAIGIVSVSYCARYNMLESVQYDRLVVHQEPTKIQNKKILVLDKNYSFYLVNQMAPAFTNSTLREAIFTEPGYYENVLLVNRMFESDLPDVIVDSRQLMKAYFDRIPALQKKYVPTPEGYRLVNN
jgi:hypothetical protein